MGGLIWKERIVGRKRVRVFANDQGAVLNGPGCHCKIVTGAGVFLAKGIEVFNLDTRETVTKGEQVPQGVSSFYNDPFVVNTGMAHPDLIGGVGTTFGEDVTDKLIVEMMYQSQAERYSKAAYGAIIFSDRVNRGSAISPGLLFKFGTEACSTAGFAKYLADHPDYGTLFSSPVFHNPNHVRAMDWSLCQIWTFIPKIRNSRFYVDESESIGIGPDTNKYKKADVLKKYKEDVGIKSGDEDLIKATYDEPQQQQAG